MPICVRIWEPDIANISEFVFTSIKMAIQVVRALVFLVRTGLETRWIQFS